MPGHTGAWKVTYKSGVTSQADIPKFMWRHRVQDSCNITLGFYYEVNVEKAKVKRKSVPNV